MEDSNDTIGNRTRDLPARSTAAVCLISNYINHMNVALWHNKCDTSLSSALFSVRTFKRNYVPDGIQTGDIVRPELPNSWQNMSLPCTM